MSLPPPNGRPNSFNSMQFSWKYGRFVCWPPPPPCTPPPPPPPPPMKIGTLTSEKFWIRLCIQYRNKVRKRDENVIVHNVSLQVSQSFKDISFPLQLVISSQYGSMRNVHNVSLQVSRSIQFISFPLQLVISSQYDVHNVSLQVSQIT